MQLMASAEYGNMQGAVIEMIMRQGTDRFLWDGSFYGQPGWLDQPADRSAHQFHRYGPERLRTAALRKRHHHARRADRQDAHGFLPATSTFATKTASPAPIRTFPERYQSRQDVRQAHLAARAGLAADAERPLRVLDNRELPTANKLLEATQRAQASVPAVTFGNLTHVSRANRVWEVSAGRYEWTQDITRSIGDPDARRPAGSSHERLQRRAFIDRETESDTLDGQGVGQSLPDRSFSAPIINGRSVASSIEASIARSGGTDRRAIRGQRAPADARDLSAVRPTPAAGSTWRRHSSPMSFSIGSRVSVAAGIRFDYARAISPDIARLDADGNETGAKIAGEGFLYSWQVLLATHKSGRAS